MAKFTLVDDAAAAPATKGKFTLVDDQPDPLQSALNKSATVGLGDAALALGSGAVAGPVSGLVGLAGTALPGPAGQGADWTRRTQDALSYEPRTATGKGLTGAVTYPFQWLAEKADTAGAATADKAGPAAGAGVNTALQALPLMLGRVAPVGEGSAAIAKRGALKAANAQTDAATTAAKEAGYSLPPSQVNPSAINQVLEGFAGKIKTGQALSIKDQQVSNSQIRQAFGIADDAPLNVDSLAKVRSEAGAAYERVRSAGRVTADPAYGKALDSLAEPYLRAESDFPKAAQTAVKDVIEAHRVGSFDASSAVDQISILRKDADKAYRDGDKKLGGTYKGIANALEEQLGRHLEQSGAPADVIANFRDARQTIAQTYTVQKHLKDNGNVDAQGLAGELKRKPLTGEIKTVAEFGRDFKKAAQSPEKIGGVPMSPLDHGFSLAALGGAVLSGHPAVAAGAVAPYLRPALRKLLASDAYQSRFVNPPTYEQPTLSRLMNAGVNAQALPYVPLLEMSEGQRR